MNDELQAWAKDRVTALLCRLIRQAASELRAEGIRALEAAGRLKRWAK